MADEDFEKMKFMGIRIPPALQRRMEVRLQLDGLQYSEYIRDLIRKDLDERGIAQPSTVEVAS